MRTLGGRGLLRGSRPAARPRLRPWGGAVPCAGERRLDWRCRRCWSWRRRGALPGGRCGTSWQCPQATVLPQGDLEWAPEEFNYSPGDSVRYIDYEKGDDSNSGTDKNAAWRHHPWDPDATGDASACRGVHTYVFKQGVVYRGVAEGRRVRPPGRAHRPDPRPLLGQGRGRHLRLRRHHGRLEDRPTPRAPPASPTRRRSGTRTSARTMPRRRCGWSWTARSPASPSPATRTGPSPTGTT